MQFIGTAIVKEISEGFKGKGLFKDKICLYFKI